MVDATIILGIFKVVMISLTISLACMYIIPILSIKRFRSAINTLTVNVCVSIIICGMYWAIYSILQMIFLDSLNQWDCVSFQYWQTVVNCQEIYALCNVSLNRFCIILYSTKLLFKTQRWIYTCIAVQWLIGFLLPLPLISLAGQSCGQMNESIWLRVYVLLIVIVVPGVFFLSMNSFILYHARSSSRRIAPSTTANHSSLASNRDIRMTKRMLILFLLFTIGWGPVYIVFTIVNTYNIWVEILKILAGLSLFGEIINLFFFNPKIWLYWKDVLLCSGKV